MTAPDDARMHHFVLLTEAEQIAAIKRMAVSGLVATTIAAATKQPVELIVKILATRGQCEACDE